MKKILTIALVLLVATGVAGLGWYWYAGSGPTVGFKTATAARGDLSATISATGTLEPEEVVDVGAQVAGMILKFGDDLHIDSIAKVDPNNSKPKFVDYNTPVTKDMVLAVIDPKVYQAQFDQADANVKRAEADIEQMDAKLVQSERDWKRAQQLQASRGAISDADYDLALATYQSAKSALGVGKATLDQAKATRQLAEINVGYTTIKSPVNGVIIDRRVNVGQTVVASLNAPSLFLIAKDLTRMQIWASVNEADIGQIKDGQPVSFTVDAYPNKKFHGTVLQVRLNATMTQQVVTYTVVVEFDNSRELLKPYLTANVQFEVDTRHDVLLVPNAALRWQPLPAQIAPDIRKEYLRSLQAKAAGLTGPGADKDGAHRGTVWVQDEGFVRPVKVNIGLSDGATTEITGGDLQDNTEIVTGTQNKSNADNTVNPFQTQMFGGKKQ